MIHTYRYSGGNWIVVCEEPADYRIIAEFKDEFFAVRFTNYLNGGTGSADELIDLWPKKEEAK